jgi:hypothetical protein
MTSLPSAAPETCTLDHHEETRTARCPHNAVVEVLELVCALCRIVMERLQKLVTAGAIQLIAACQQHAGRKLAAQEPISLPWS